MLEKDFQAKLIKRLEQTFPDAIILKNDANYKQGIPDLLILYQNRWATLECKVSSHASRQPLQNYYIDTMARMSYAAFIYPDNEDTIIDELIIFFGKD